MVYTMSIIESKVLFLREVLDIRIGLRSKKKEIKILPIREILLTLS